MTPPIRRLGDFEILRELGRGGMGVVYEARQVSLNRKVALKLLSGTLGLTSKAVIRFKREAEAAAKLHHTNIVPIYATGEQDGMHYYAMELIDGPALNQLIAQMRNGQGGTEHAQVPERESDEDLQETATLCATDVSRAPPGDSNRAAMSTSAVSSLGSGGGQFDAAARMIAEVADALDYAHAQGVMHRDIKPSNLLLSPDGRLHMNDFGLARMLEQPGMTVSGEFVGSPMYMSPEQIAVGRAPLDHRTDIYSLGTTLYEFLTLEPPFPGERRDQVIGQIIHKEPRRPRTINRKIPVDLETICLKAMEKDPDKRYQTAGDLANDLRAYVNRFAISARRVGPVGRAVRWCKRHKALAAAMGCAAIAIVVAASVGYRAHVADQRHRAEAIEQELSEANRIALDGDYDRADQAVQRAVDLGATDGRVHLLRGEIAGCRTDNETAVKELKLAVKALPQSQEARASLANAYMNLYQFDTCLSTLAEAEALPSRTAGDYLALGMMVGSVDPERGIALLDKAVELRHAPYALLARAYTRIGYAENTMDAHLVDLSLRDVEAARTILSADDPNAISSGMNIRLAAARMYGLLGMETERQALLKLAADDIAAMEKLPPSRERIGARFSYYEETDQMDPALHWLESLYRQYPDGRSAMVYEAELYKRGDDAKAIAVTPPDNLDAEVTSAFPLMETGPDGARKAMEIYARIQKNSNVFTRLYSHYIPLLLGDTDIARADALALRATGVVFPNWRGWSNHVLDYHCGLLSDEQLLQFADKSNWSHCEAYFNIGLRRLTEGNRPAALAMFRKSAATRMYDYEECYLSTAFINRMEKDPEWPRWITSAGAASSASTQSARQ
jgi:tetratricopeptide (TPR) repeat protein